jgi:hypothetical protein
MLEVFPQQHTASGLLCRAQHKCLPKRNLVKAVEVDGCQDAGYIRHHSDKYVSRLGLLAALPTRLFPARRGHDDRVDVLLSGQFLECGYLCLL